MSSHGTFSFCTVFSCMDGRCQRQVNAWCREEFEIEHPDTITIAGCDGVLATDDKANEVEWERALRMARISSEAHGSRQAVVIGHSLCVGYPVSPEEHRTAIKKAVGRIVGTGLFETVVGLYNDVDAKTLEEVCRVSRISTPSSATA